MPISNSANPPMVRRSIAALPHLPFISSVTPATTLEKLHQAAGWGFTGLGIAPESTAVAAPFHFVYRKRKRLRAKKFIT